jgi:uncharacterized membrane protein SpoIIM required for sporulation
MVLEKLVTPKTAEEHAAMVLLAGGIIASVSALVSYFVFVNSSFEQQIGIFLCFFVTITILPFMINIGRYDEAREENLLKARKKMNIFLRHRTIIKVYIAFFLGVILSLYLLYLILPENVVNKVFSAQLNEIYRIRGKIVGDFILTNAFSKTFSSIIKNNVQVLILSFLFSFIFGSGGIYILTWNSSVLAAAMGATFKSHGAIYTLQYFPHGSLEFLAYFIGAIAGSIISVAITRRKHKYFWFVVKDSMELFLFSLIILMVAAFIETLAIFS